MKYIQPVGCKTLELVWRIKWLHLLMEENGQQLVAHWGLADLQQLVGLSEVHIQGNEGDVVDSGSTTYMMVAQVQLQHIITAK
jgi:hypothetical protein